MTCKHLPLSQIHNGVHDTVPCARIRDQPHARESIEGLPAGCSSGGACPGRCGCATPGGGLPGTQDIPVLADMEERESAYHSRPAYEKGAMPCWCLPASTYMSPMLSEQDEGHKT